MGVGFLIVGAIYVGVLITVTAVGYNWNKKSGWTKARGAIVGFLVITLPVFWDWIPTVLLHSYYCDAYAGLTVTKTPEQWKSENPEEAKTLVRQTPPLQVGSGDKRYFQLNQRFRWETENTEKPLWLRQYESRVVDGKSGAVLVRLVDFSTGISGHAFYSLRDYKFWMYRQSCYPLGQSEGGEKFGEYRLAYQNMGERK